MNAWLMMSNYYDMWVGDKDEKFVLTRKQIQDVYVDGTFDGVSDSMLDGVESFEAEEAIGAIRGCAYWPHKCEDCPMCGGESVIPPTRYNSSL